MSATEGEKVQTESTFPVIRGDIAIIGMECIYAGSPDVATLWQNILSKVDCIIDVPSDRWDPETFYDPNHSVEDKLHCKRGGYLPGAIPFNPLKYGIMPISVEGVEPDQYITLDLVYNMLEKSGYLNSSMEKTEIIIGKGNYLSAGHANLVQRRVVTTQTLQIIESMHPEYTQEEMDKIKEELHSGLRNFNSETAPSLIPNLTTGRTANRLDFMGPNFMLDGACASVLIATDLCIRDLLTGKCDLAVAGGAHVCNDVPLLMLFEAFHAVSPTYQIRPFDKDADGTIPGEGVGAILLKRLEDAERDGDTIYAVIKGVGVSSDGRAMSVTAPRVEGAALALRRAYEMADIDPQTIELIEAHGTGTAVGDAAEIEALKKIFGLKEDESKPPWCAIGSVKSMIGHALPGSGAASIIKTVLALYHKVLPPTLNCDQPNPKFELEKTPFYINTETRPWIHSSKDVPRRAGINAFGFGGINSHLILEEYCGTDEEETRIAKQNVKSERPHYHQKWDTEVFILESDSRDALMQEAQNLQQYLADAPQVSLKDLAYTLNTQAEFGGSEKSRLAIIASSADELSQKLNYALERLSDQQCKQIKDIKGTYYFESPLYTEGKLAFLFPGEGSQYVNMLSDLCIHFPEVRACFDRTDQTFIAQKRPYLPSQFIFPAPSFTKEERKKAEERLWQMDGAIEAVLTANWALTILLDTLDIKPDMIVGHSSGEFSSLLAAGVADADESYFQNLNILNTYYERAAADGAIPSASMVAVGTDAENIKAILNEIDGDIYVAMDNCPHQSVVVGEEQASEQLIELLTNKGIMYEKLKFDRGYHTPMFEEICESLHGYFTHVPMRTPNVELYSCTTMAPFPKDPEEIRRLVIEHWMRPVEFRKTIEAMYEAGARLFVEVGPRGNLIAFIDDILRGRSYLAMPANVTRRSGITQLNHLVGILAAHGVPMRLDYLYTRRSPRKLTLTAEDVRVDEKDKEKNTMLMLDFPIMDVSEERKEAAKKRMEQSTGQSPVKSSQPSSTDLQPQPETKVPEPRTPIAASEASSARSSVPLSNGGKGVVPEQKPSQLPKIDAAGISPTKTVEKHPQQGKASEQTTQVASQTPASSASKMGSQPQTSKQDIPQPQPTSKREFTSPTRVSDLQSTSPTVSNLAESNNSSLVMQQYLRTMENFLEVQQEVMQTYLTNAASVSPQRQIVSTPQPGLLESLITKDTGELAYPETPTVTTPHSQETNPSPLEQVASLSPQLDELPQHSKEAAETVSLNPISNQGLEVSRDSELISLGESSEISIESLKQTLLGLVSDKTGYPTEMLDLNLDMEADLGIDSIKRVEILGAFQEHYTLSQSLETEVDIEQIASLKTLQQVIDFLSEQIGGGNGNNPVETTTSGTVDESYGTTPLPTFERGTTTIANTPSNTTDISSFPFIGDITSLKPGEEIVVTRRIDWNNEDIFMEDHTFGPEISNLDPTLKGVPIIPLTVGLEMMLEAAAAMMHNTPHTSLSKGDKQLTGIRNLRAHQWIQVENPVTLQIIARRQESSEADEVKVEIRSLEENPEDPMLMMSVTTVFEDFFPEAPLGPETFPLNSERVPQRTAEEIYRTHYMFHGPRFHKMASLDRMGDDGLIGQLEMLPGDNLFRSNPNPSFIINPIFMDAIGQLVGYWPFENLKTGYLILPMGIKSVSIYRPDQPVSERFTCYLRIIDITPTFVRANIDVVCPDGRLWMRVEGWEDWRYYFPVELFDFWRFPNKEMISKPFDTMLSQLPEEISMNLECLRIKHFKELDSTLWETVWAYLILNRDERKNYQSFVEKKQGERRVQWLLGRSAAKDSIRTYIKKRYGIELYPADIEISEDEYGRPIPQGAWTQALHEAEGHKQSEAIAVERSEQIEENVPSVSVTHTREGALGLAGPGNLMIGIDLETINSREPGFEKLAFAEEERALLSDLDESMREEWMTRFWCAKEAVAKALGRGLMNGPRGLIVKEMDSRTGVVKVTIVGKFADEFPQFANTEIIAYTIRDENEIIASAICGRS